jgi:hypothetical protein
MNNRSKHFKTEQFTNLGQANSGPKMKKIDKVLMALDLDRKTETFSSFDSSNDSQKTFNFSENVKKLQRDARENFLSDYTFNDSNTFTNNPMLAWQPPVIQDRTGVKNKDYVRGVQQVTITTPPITGLPPSSAT